MFRPWAPNFLLSSMTAWKWHNPKRMPLVRPSSSSYSSRLNVQKACLMFAFKPEGGSLVSLMDLSRMPIGMEFEGSLLMKTRKFSWEPDEAYSSSNFSTFFNHRGIKWTLFRMTQCPDRCAASNL